MGGSRSNLAFLGSIDLSKTILSHVLGAVHSHQVWEQIHDHFFTQTKARAKQLHTDLRAQSLENKTMKEFMGQVKLSQINLLESVVLSRMMNILMLFLKVFPQEYAPVISIIKNKFETPTITEVEALLLANESRTNRF